MALVLREADVHGLLQMDAIVPALEAAMTELGRGIAENQARRRVRWPGGLLNVMSASYPGARCSGLKTYTVAAGKARFMVVLFGPEGGLEALLEADALGAYRTGAATALAVRTLARKRALDVAMIGTGHQALTQALALSTAVELRSLRVYGRNAERRAAFAEQASALCRRPVDEAMSAQEAVRDADVVVCITTSREPVFEAEWVQPGTVVVGAGSNQPNRSEVPPALVSRAHVVVDQLATAKLESGDLLRSTDEGQLDWERVLELGDILAGNVPVPELGGDEVLLFESHGLALWDVATARLVVDRARAQGVGSDLQLSISQEFPA